MSATTKIVETTLTASAVRMRLANDADPAKADEWVDLVIPIDRLRRGSGEPIRSSADLESLDLATIQAIALHHARDVVAAEMARLPNP
jgi:hypothetical protein